MFECLDQFDCICNCTRHERKVEGINLQFLLMEKRKSDQIT